jgi:hypothetical protein
MGDKAFVSELILTCDTCNTPFSKTHWVTFLGLTKETRGCDQTAISRLLNLPNDCCMMRIVAHASKAEEYFGEKTSI